MATRRALAFGAVAVVPTAVDVGGLVALRQGLGLPLVVADLLAVLVAAAVSWRLHRATTFAGNPYFRWVRHPGAFAVLALVAGVVDAAVLRIAFATTGFSSTVGLLAAKAVSLATAIVVRAIGYRWLLHDVVAQVREPEADSLPSQLPGPVRLSVVIPAYRAGGIIAGTVTRIRAELADVDASGGVEIVVVDDGSGDGTSEAALAAGADQVVTLPRNRGKGAAVRAGVLASRGGVVAFTDADLAYDPTHLRDLLERVEAGWDVAIGSRRHPDSAVARSSGLRRLGSRVVSGLSAAVLLAGTRDTQCGLKGFRGDLARSLFAVARVDGFAFDIEVLHLVERAERSLTEIPVHLDERTEVGSTVRVLDDVVHLAADLLRVRRWAAAGAYDALDEIRTVGAGSVASGR